MDNIAYKEGDSFIVGPKTPKHTMDNAKTDTAVVWFAAIGAKDVPILVPAEWKLLILNQLFWLTVDLKLGAISSFFNVKY